MERDAASTDRADNSKRRSMQAEFCGTGMGARSEASAIDKQLITDPTHARLEDSNYRNEKGSR